MSRYFENPWLNYSPNDYPTLLSNSEKGIKMTPQFREELLTGIDEIEKDWEMETKILQKRRDNSIYTGSAGYALVYLLQFDRNHRKNDKLAANHAHAILMECLQGAASKGRCSYLCGDGGVLGLAAITSHMLGRPAGEYVDRLASMCDAACSPSTCDELLYGRAGYLYTLMLLDRLKVGQDKVRPLLPVVAEAILKSGQAMVAKKGLRNTPLMYMWHDKTYYGAAHGLVGILVILMQAAEHLPRKALEDLVRPTVDFLRGELFPSGNLPSSEGSQSGDKLVHWCHGAPGAVMLFGMAYKVFGREEDLATARGCAEVVWQRGLLKKGFGLCHGVAGNGYSFLYLYQLTNEQEYLFKAYKFGEWCVTRHQDYGHAPDRPCSLFEGTAGHLHFLIDLLDADKAVFPGLILPVVD